MHTETSILKGGCYGYMRWNNCTFDAITHGETYGFS